MCLIFIPEIEGILSEKKNSNTNTNTDNTNFNKPNESVYEKDCLTDILYRYGVYTYNIINLMETMTKI